MLKRPLSKKSAFTPLEIKRSRRRSHKFLTGFTLIELITAVSLVGLIFAAGITALISIVQFYSIEQAKHRASDELILALNWIKKDAMQADSANVDTPNVLTLTVTDYASADRPFPFNTITYSVTGTTTLQRDHQTEGIRNITNIIDSSNLPVYTTPNPNYLLVQMGTEDADRAANQRMGVTLGCRDDFDSVGITRNNNWSDARVGSRRTCNHPANWGDRA